MITSIVDFLLTGLVGILGGFMSLLPALEVSDIVSFEGAKEILGFVNWVVPIEPMLDIAGIFFGAVLIYNFYLVFVSRASRG